mmetsp:Transcript_36007/g.75813  ORF Transcript_36007/g.75813 Transcript_36007/m.75813 type:complete len:229 (-) Transcript_36007:118-804(-)
MECHRRIFCGSRCGSLLHLRFSKCNHAFYRIVHTLAIDRRRRRLSPCHRIALSTTIAIIIANNFLPATTAHTRSQRNGSLGRRHEFIPLRRRRRKRRRRFLQTRRHATLPHCCRHPTSRRGGAHPAVIIIFRRRTLPNGRYRILGGGEEVVSCCRGTHHCVATSRRGRGIVAIVMSPRPLLFLGGHYKSFPEERLTPPIFFILIPAIANYGSFVMMESILIVVTVAAQ